MKVVNANDNYADFDIVLYQKPRKNWRARILFATIVLVGYGGGGWIAYWICSSADVGTLVNGAGMSLSKLGRGVLATMIYCLIIMATMFSLFWAFGSDGKVARTLRGD